LLAAIERIERNHRSLLSHTASIPSIKCLPTPSDEPLPYLPQLELLIYAKVVVLPMTGDRYRCRRRCSVDLPESTMASTSRKNARRLCDSAEVALCRKMLWTITTTLRLGVPP